MSNPKGNPASLTAPRFAPSVSGNPGGKPQGARNRLQGAFANGLAADFEAHGIKAIREAREKDPLGYVKVVASLMPKEMALTKPLEDLTDDELTAGIALLRSRLTEGAGTGSDPTAAAETAH